MIVFFIIASLVESMLLILTMTYYCGVYQKIRVLLFVVLGVAGALFFELVLHHHDYLMFYYLFLLILCSPMENNCSIFSMIMIPVILLVSLIFSEAISAIIVGIVGETINSIYSVSYFSMIVSKIIYSLFCFVFCFFHDRGEEQSQYKHWWLFIFFILIILLLFLTIVYYFILQTFSEMIMYMMIAELLLLGFLSFMIYRQMKVENEDKLALQLEIEKQKHSQYMMDMTNHMNNRIENDKHRMIYVLMKMKTMVENNIDMCGYIDQEIDYLTTYRTLILTNNPLFDSELTKQVNSLQALGYDVKTILILEENDMLSDAYLVSLLMKYIEMMASINDIDQKININMQQKKNYLIFKIHTRTNQDENKIKTKELLQLPYVKKLDISKKLDYCTLSIVLSN